MPAFLGERIAMSGPGLELVPARCCICELDTALPVGLGEDFEYRVSADSFLAVRCPECSTVFLNPRPAPAEEPRIYPPNYHAFEFSPQRFGLIYRIRRRLEASRLLAWCRGLPKAARILDVGCGDGFHLRLLADFGCKSWQLEGVDTSSRAIEAAARAGLQVHRGDIRELDLPAESYDLVLLIMTVEHAADPAGMLEAIARLLKPGGRVAVVTDNIASPNFHWFRRRYWGGYHFPRHFYLFDAASLRRLAAKAGLKPSSVRTAMSPINWCYSIHNALVDWQAPRWLTNRFTIRSFVALSALTIWDGLLTLFGRGSILHGVFSKPAGDAA
jgi:SAM-dependent methyltransferase